MHAWFLLPALFGCQRSATCDSSEYICDTGAYWERRKAQEVPPPDTTAGTWIEIVRLPGCNGAPDTWTYSARVQGPVSDTARVDVWATEEAGGFNEEHPLAPVESGNGFTEFAVELRDEANAQQYQPGTSTTYVCGETDQQRVLTFALRAYDASGALADCAVWTAMPDVPSAIQGVFDATLPEPNEVTARAELTADNCRTWTLPGG